MRLELVRAQRTPATSGARPRDLVIRARRIDAGQAVRWRASPTFSRTSPRGRRRGRGSRPASADPSSATSATTSCSSTFATVRATGRIRCSATAPLRRALTMALDRRCSSRSVFDSLGTVGLGPFVRAQWSADTNLVTDAVRPSRALNGCSTRSAGALGRDGVRARGGRPLAFTLRSRPRASPAQRMAVLIQEQLRLAGVRVEIEQLDNNAMGERFETHTFDAAMGGLAATSDAERTSKQTWTAPRRARAASTTDDTRARRSTRRSTAPRHGGNESAARRRTITPPTRSSSTTRRRSGCTSPRSWPARARASASASLRPDAWWMGIPGWSIAPGKRLPRDAAPAASP